jgi:threonine dehydrogenase-like Zn-dependent dehydrogenase
MCEPFAIGVYAVRQSAVKSDDSIAVLGAGPIGLSCLAAARSQKLSKIYMTEIIPERLETASRNGTAWTGNPHEEDIVESILDQVPGGVDIVYECAGKQETIDQAVDVLCPGGKLMLIGIPREDRISFKIDLLRRKEITVINVRRQNACTQAAIDLIASGRADVDFMVTHHFDFERSKEAFDLVADYKEGVIKAMIHIT